MERNKAKSFADTTQYCQIHSLWVSNCINFYKKNKNTNNGLFEKEMESDDGQHWYGTGKFLEKNNNIILFEFLLIHTLNNKKDTSKIESLTYIKNKDSLILNDDNSKTIFIKKV